MDFKERLRTRLEVKRTTMREYSWIEFTCTLCGQFLERNMYCRCYRPRSKVREMGPKDWETIEAKTDAIVAKIEELKNKRKSHE